MRMDMEDDEKGKLFVGGLSWETTCENLQQHFSRFGEVIDCVVMKNNETGRSRGFGFVTFADPAKVANVLQSGPHFLDGRTIDPKQCNPRTLQKPKKGGNFPKIFLGGLPSNLTETDLRTFFNRYGKVVEVVIMYDQEKKKSRGFGFLSFEEEAAVERLTQEHFINLNGKQVEIKRAEPRDAAASGGGKMGMGGMGGGMGVGGGGGGGGPMSSYQWHQAASDMMAAQGHNGQLASPMNMTPMSMIGGYQGGWGTGGGQQQNYGYGTPNAPSSYQGWSGPPAPQGPPAHQWSNYAAQQTPQGYGSYDMYNPSTGPNAASAANNWNSWNVPPNSGTTAQAAAAAAGKFGSFFNTEF